MADQPIPSNESPERDRARDFEAHATAAESSIVGEFVAFLLHNKKWWLAPILLVLALVGLLVILSSSAAAPFIYAIF